MSEAGFQALLQWILGCQFLSRVVCFLALWRAFFRPKPDWRNAAAAGALAAANLIWWFSGVSFRFGILPAVLILLYCHIHYGKYYEKAVFVMLLSQNIWSLSLLIASCVQEHLSNLLVEYANHPESFLPDVEIFIYTSLAKNQILTGAVFIAVLLLLTVPMILSVKNPLDLKLSEAVFLSVLNLVGYLSTRMIFDISAVKLDREVFSLFMERRDWIWKVPMLALLLYAGELAAVCVWQKAKLLQEEQERHFVEKQQAEAIRKRLEEAENFYGNIRRVRHEMRNHMLNIKGLVARESYEAVESYVDRLEETIEELEYRYSTGNAVTDVIINDRYQRAKRAGIDFQVNFAWKEETGISVFDFGIILSNLLDNALNACEKAEPENRYVNLTLQKKARFWLLEVENSFNGETKPTPDARGEHGIGLKNVQDLAERYLGGVKLRTDGNVFRVTVMLQEK